MRYRIVKRGNCFELQGSFPIGWFGRLIGAKTHWYWIFFYDTLEEAIRGRDFLTGAHEIEPQVVG